jgi:hypothetical protein
MVAVLFANSREMQNDDVLIVLSPQLQSVPL